MYTVKNQYNRSAPRGWASTLVTVLYMGVDTTFLAGNYRGVYPPHISASGSSIGQRPCVARPGAVPPAHDTPYGARSPHWPWGQPGRYFDRAGDRRSAGAAPPAVPPPPDPLFPPRRVTGTSHPPTPPGRPLAVAP